MSLVARLTRFAVVLSGAVLVVLPAVSFAADIRVDVVDNAYDDGDRDGNAVEEDERRDHTVITAGDAVVWEWKGDNQHTVTSQPTSTMAFDSDSDCADQEDDTPCRTKGNEFTVRFDEPGTYGYFCKVHVVMTGTIEVQEPPEPSEDDDGGGDGGSEPSSEPTSEEASSEPESSGSDPASEPQEGQDEDPFGEGETQDEPTNEPDTSDDRPPRRQATGPGFGVQRQPQGDFQAGPGPQVAPETAPGPSFSPFPTAPDVPSESETGDMAVTVPGRDGGGPSRGVVVGVAVASLLGAAGAFGKVVLFGQPWT